MSCGTQSVLPTTGFIAGSSVLIFYLFPCSFAMGVKRGEDAEVSESSPCARGSLLRQCKG